MILGGSHLREGIAVSRVRNGAQDPSSFPDDRDLVGGVFAPGGVGLVEDLASVSGGQGHPESGGGIVAAPVRRVLLAQPGRASGDDVNPGGVPLASGCEHIAR